MNAIGSFLLAVWLISRSVTELLNLKFPYGAVALPVLALSAGIFILWPAIRLRKGIGWLLLSLWLILSAGMALFDLSFSHSGTFLAIIALLAGIFLIVRK